MKATHAATMLLYTNITNGGDLKLVVADAAGKENHIRCTLRAFGPKMGQIGHSSYESRARELIEGLDAATAESVVAMLEVRRGVWKGYMALQNLVVRIVKDDPVCRRLMTVPGVGPIAVLTFRAAVDDPLRFARSRALDADFGLTPKVHQSDTIARDGHIPKRGDIDVRTSLCEAGASLLMRVQK